MSVPFQVRHGSTALRTAFTPKTGEFFYDSDLNVLYVGDGSTVGGNPISGPGLRVPTSFNLTADHSILASEAGTYFGNSGASGTVILTLPAGEAAGLVYSAVVFAAQTLRFAASGGATIKGGTTFSASTIESNQPYSSLTLVNAGTTLWLVTSTVGNWS